MADSRVIITGAARGIGAAAAAQLRGRGANVVGLDINAPGDLLACDVTDPDSVERAVAEAIERLGGGLDVLVNNAGVGFAQSAGLPPDERATTVFEVNMLGPWRMTAAALPALRASRGRVSNVASGLAHVTVPFLHTDCHNNERPRRSPGAATTGAPPPSRPGPRCTSSTAPPSRSRRSIPATSRRRSTMPRT